MKNLKEKTYFIALPLPDDAKRQLAAWCEEQKEEYSFRKWVHSQDYHITLKYLGPCSLQTLGSVKQKLASALSSGESFTLAIDGLGTFGRSDSPRILWAGVQGRLTSLHQLQFTVEQAMEEIGFPKEQRPYRPHVTLAKHFQGQRWDIEALAARFSLDLPSWQVSFVVLYRTELGRQPMYVQEAVYSFDA